MSQPERPALLVWADHCTCGKVHIDVYDGDVAPLTGRRDIVRALRAGNGTRSPAAGR